MKTKSQLGLTCISEQLKLKDKKKYSFRTMTRKRFNDLCKLESRHEAINQLSERILHNIIVTQYIINHCGATNIGHYRLSSSLFPLLTDSTLEISLEELPNCSTIKQELRLAGIIAQTLKISIGSHPDQFNVLASNNKDAVKRTINELNFQASVLDKLGLPQDHTAPMNIHINYTPQADETLEVVATRFFRNLSMCDKGVYRRLTIENEDKGFFNVDNCIKFSDYLFDTFKAAIPVCYDNLHDFCNPSKTQNVAWQAERCAYTWVNQHKPHSDSSKVVADFLAPVFHWSEGKPEKPRAHADYFALGRLPPHIAIDPDRPAIWECEVKLKDIAMQRLVEGININSKKNNLDNQKQLQYSM
jgi:UV DNA damage repair endonuclease